MIRFLAFTLFIGALLYSSHKVQTHVQTVQRPEPAVVATFTVPATDGPQNALQDPVGIHDYQPSYGGIQR